MTEEAVRQLIVETVAQAVSKAGAESGWVSMMFAAIVFGGLISLGIIVWKVLTAYFDTQTFIRTEFLKTLNSQTNTLTKCDEAMREVSVAMHRFATAIERAPCTNNKPIANLEPARD